MKKAFMLVAAVAMLAAPVFAEITVSGDVELMYNYDIASDKGVETLDDDAGNSVELDLGIAIGEYTTLNAALSADADSLNNDPTDQDADNAVTLGDWYVTQDVTGALGLDMPVTLSAKIGDVSFKGMQYTDELTALTDDDDGDNTSAAGNQIGFDMNGSYLNYLLAFGVMDMVTVEFGIFPLTYQAMPGDWAQFGVNAYGVFGPTSLATYFAYNRGAMDMEVSAAMDFAPVTAGFQFQVFDMEDGIDTDARSYVYATYTSDFGLAATLEYFGYTMMTDMEMDLAADAAYAMEIAEGMTADAEFGASNIMETYADLKLNVGVGVSYAMSSVVELHANFDVNNITDEPADNLELNLGTALSIDSMTYAFDYTMDTDGKTDYLGTAGGDTIHQVSFLATASF